MKFYVGYIFTESIINHLANYGFYFQKNDATLKNGYREYILPFSNSNIIELRQIIDEDLYFKSENKKDFAPFTYENSRKLDLSTHPNTTISLNGTLDATMDESELKNFLQIRKRHPLWAIVLSCSDFNIFEKKTDRDHLLTWKDHKVAIIHLGSACFDLIIQEVYP